MLNNGVEYLRLSQSAMEVVVSLHIKLMSTMETYETSYFHAITDKFLILITSQTEVSNIS